MITCTERHFASEEYDEKHPSGCDRGWNRDRVARRRRPAAGAGRSDGLDPGLAGGADRHLQGPPVHLPGRVLAELAVTLADGGDCLADLAGLRDQAALFGPVASHPRSYRVLDRVGTAQLELLRAARADARARVWVAGGGPDLTDPAGLILDVDATLLTAHRQARRHPDLQARLRVPPFAGLPRPPRPIRRRSPGRDPAPG